MREPTPTNKKKKAKDRTSRPSREYTNEELQDKADSSVPGGWRNVLFGGGKVPGINNGFKNRPAGVDYELGYHTGVDFSKPAGTPVNIPLSGTVQSAGWGGAYGNTIVVKLDSGEYMRFAHLKSIGVSAGQRVKAGQYVGSVGKSGTNSSGNHLHLEVMTKASGGRFGSGNFLDPVAFLNGKKVTAKPDSGPSGDTTTYSNVEAGLTSNTGSGGGIKVPKFTKKDFYAMLEKNFGGIDAIMKMDEEARAELGGKSIKWAIDQMVKQKVVDPVIMRTYLEQTAWFMKYSNEISDRLVEERNRPELFKSNQAETRAGIETMLNEKGVQVAPDVLDQLARNAYVYGWSADTIIDEVQKQGDALTFTGGGIAESIADLETYAEDFGVQLTDADIRKFRMDYLDNLGDEATKQAIQERAAQTYTVFADQIRKGQATKVLAGAYFAKAAQLLELSPDEIDWSDPLFTGGRAFTTVDEKGQQVQKGLWDFEKEVRKDARWLGTKNAKDETMGTAAGVLKMMGLA